jgi:membrane-associated phospholipid phosphatase
VKKTLPFFSYLFHPIFISVFAALFYFFVITDRYFLYENVYLYVIQILLLTVFIPLAFFYLLIMLGKIDSIMISNVDQRKIPLFLQVVLLSVLIFKSITLDNLPELFYFYLGSIISSAFALILAFFNRKVSLHMMGIASLTIFCISASMHFQIKPIVFISLLLFCNGLVASSRLYMKAHSINEIIVGYLIGLIPQLLLLLFWL